MRMGMILGYAAASPTGEAARIRTLDIVFVPKAYSSTR
jgi:hypothetical protein